MAAESTGTYRFGDLLALTRQSWLGQMTSRLERLGFADYRRSDAAALRMLGRGPLPVGQLGTVLGVTRQAARKVADALEQRGYATTERDPRDTRQLNVTLTQLGRDYARAITAVISELNREVAGRVSPAQLAAADAVLRAALFDESARRRASRLPPPARALGSDLTLPLRHAMTSRCQPADLRPGQYRVHVRDELARTERLDHIVVGSRGEPGRDVSLLRQRGQEDDRDVRRGRILAELPAHLQAGHAGHHDVQESQVRRMRARVGQRGQAVAELPDLVTLPPELEGHQELDVRVIFGQKDRGHPSPSRGSRPRSGAMCNTTITHRKGDAMAGIELPQQRREPQVPQHERERELELTCMSNLLAANWERVYFKDLQSRFLLVSAGWIAAYAPGRTAEELIGKTDFDVFSGQHASAAFGDEQQVIRTGEPIIGKVELETYGGRADTWVSTTKMPLRDQSGEIIGTFGISRDVTAQIRAEHTLAEQALQLRAQNQSLRDLDRLKDEFIGLVSHEIRTPLASIIGYVELLKDDIGGPDAGLCAEVIDRNARRLQHLVGDLLFLSQIQSGKLTMEFRDTDLAGLAASAVEELRPEAQRKHIDLALSATEVPHLAVDPMRIAQVLGNLLSNAVKFTPDGGRVEVRLSRGADQAVLAVADSGIGIPADDQVRIFERFFRTAIAARHAIQGSGLGLAVTKAIVEAHHGTITVDSDEGRGSTFTVRLPLN
jgi:PAS domain S-box-containing protein